MLQQLCAFPVASKMLSTRQFARHNRTCRLTRRGFHSSTLSPTKLRPADVLETLPPALSKYYQKPVAQDPQKSLALQHRGSCINWETSTPPNPCRGFLYHHAPRPASPFAGSLRYRLTPGFDPTSSVSPQAAFAAGSDLQIPGADALPWSVPLWTVVQTRRLVPYSDMLRADGVQTSGQQWKPMAEADLTESSVALYALGQPFLVEFHMAFLRVYLFQPYPKPPLCGRIEVGFFDWTSPVFHQPYEGLGIMTLERLEGSLGIRLQKILSLSRRYANDNIAPPVEGETRPFQVAPVLFKEATKRTSPKYISGTRHLWQELSKLPHVSEMAVS
ncbi:hypothetical protein C8R45DRAFT_520617 [Mycena sanguinolenta]|nr:hypothetical protein C8R45DRAFT_520617 [Mycena sanguinolenta]